METNIPPSSSGEKSEGKVSGCDVGVGQSPAAPGRGQGSKAAHGEHKGKKGGPKRSAQGDKVLTTKSKPAPQDKQANTKPSHLNDQAKGKPSAQNEQPVATSSTDQAKATPTPPDHQAKATPPSDDQTKTTPTPPADQVNIQSGVGDKGKEEPSTAPGGALKREPQEGTQYCPWWSPQEGTQYYPWTQACGQEGANGCNCTPPPPFPPHWMLGVYVYYSLDCLLQYNIHIFG